MENDILFKFKGMCFDAFNIKKDEIQPKVLFQNLFHVIKETLSIKEVQLVIASNQIFPNSYNHLYEILEIHHIIKEMNFHVKNLKENDLVIFHEINIDRYNRILYIKNENDQVYGAIFMRVTSQVPYSNTFWLQLSEIIHQYLVKVVAISKLMIDEYRNKRLSNVSDTFHSSMDINDVLREIVKVLKEIFPFYEHSLFLSTDTIQNKDLPVKNFDYLSSNQIAMKTYVTGEFQMEERNSDHIFVLYAPIKGKQGVYGVLEVIAPPSMMPEKEDIEFITVLAKTAGNALENAHLYQQSRRLIDDLQLINDTSRKLNANLIFSDTLTFMSDLFKTSFQVEEFGFFQLKENQYTLLPGHTSFFEREGVQSYIQVIYEELEKNKEAIFFGDTSQHQLLHSCPYQTIIAIPMTHSQSFLGFVIVLQKEPYSVTFESFKLMQSLIQHWTLAFMNSLLREELEKLVITDYLTKLYSRNYLDQKIEESMLKDIEGTFILVDIDNFKDVNDRFGHQTGDKILIQVANIIKEHIRSTDIAARWGGEELAIYLPGSSLQTGISVSERLIEKVQEETNPKVTISCGISHWKKSNYDTPLKLFKRADEALYQAKRLGKNRTIHQITDKIG